MRRAHMGASPALSVATAAPAAAVTDGLGMALSSPGVATAGVATSLRGRHILLFGRIDGGVGPRVGAARRRSRPLPRRRRERAEPRTSLVRVNSIRINAATFGNAVSSVHIPINALRPDIGKSPPTDG